MQLERAKPTHPVFAALVGVDKKVVMLGIRRQYPTIIKLQILIHQAQLLIARIAMLFAWQSLRGNFSISIADEDENRLLVLFIDFNLQAMAVQTACNKTGKHPQCCRTNIKRKTTGNETCACLPKLAHDNTNYTCEVQFQ